MPMHSLFGVDLPIIQAPMAGVQGRALAAAVSAAGGLGSLPCALLGPAALRTELEALRSRGAGGLRLGAFNLNFFCHRPPAADTSRDPRWLAALEPYFMELGVDRAAIPSGPGRQPFTHETASVVEPFRPAVVSFHFGLPDSELLARVRGWGSKVLSTATTVEEALWLESKGVDAIIAQGLEAGGHRGHFLSDDLTVQAGTFALVRRIVRAVRTPVIAAGGIFDRQGVAAAMALGAVAAQVGTAYLLCPEAATSAIHRAALKGADAGHTALTNLFSGRPARGIMNRLMRDLGPVNPLAPAFPQAALAIAPLRAAAEKQERGDFSPLWAGQAASACREAPAGRLTRELAGVDDHG